MRVVYRMASDAQHVEPSTLRLAVGAAGRLALAVGLLIGLAACGCAALAVLG